MNQAHYVIADLQQDVVEEIQKIEEQLSMQTGFPVALIAYTPNHAMDERQLPHP